MPWCEPCTRFFTPPSMNPDGSCPACGRVLVAPGTEAAEPKAPWHFKLLVAAVALYLLWRLVQLVGMLVT